MFFKSQPIQNQQEYINLLKAVGGLSKLYSNSKTPYLYYRSHENIFCLSLDASNESRGDVSVDAVKGKVGIGLKTFLYRGSQYEKIAEFNKLLSTYRHLSGIELVKVIAKARNERITLTSRIYDLDEVIYHCVARKEGRFIIYETAMELIEIDSIVIDTETASNITFHDNKQSYKFNFSKSTLFKKFEIKETTEFQVEIIDNPYSLLITDQKKPHHNKFKQLKLSKVNAPGIKEYVILPLYSLRGEMHVPTGSGLNQWNASGRVRNENEVYIPIPLWIHGVFKDFFPPRDEAFNLELPGNRIISAKVCQANSKALMSNPNKVLGEWLLRKVLNLSPGTLVTYEMLLKAGVDSVIVSKNSNNDYEIDFKAVGSYENFKAKYETEKK